MLKFKRNVETGQRVRFFRRVALDNKKATGCKDMGLFDVAGFPEEGAFVRMVQSDRGKPPLNPTIKREQEEDPPKDGSLPQPPKKQKR